MSFCSKCGYKVDQQSDTIQKSYKTKKLKKPHSKLGIASFSLLIITIVTFIISEFSQNTQISSAFRVVYALSVLPAFALTIISVVVTVIRKKSSFIIPILSLCITILFSCIVLYHDKARSSTINTSQNSQAVQQSTQSSSLGNESKPQNNVKHDFLKSDWGMTKSQIRSLSKYPPNMDNYGMIRYYPDNAFGEIATITYCFYAKDDLLNAGRLDYDVNGFSANNCIIEYGHILDGIKQDYGEPNISSGAIFKNKKYNNDQYVTAFENGDLTLDSEWDVNETKISFKLEKTGGKNYLWVLFQSDKYPNVNK